MRILVLTACLFGLAACGAETATTAATVGQLKAKEAEEAERKMDRAQSELDEAMRKAEQRRSAD